MSISVGTLYMHKFLISIVIVWYLFNVVVVVVVLPETVKRPVLIYKASLLTTKLGGFFMYIQVYVNRILNSTY